MGWPVLTAGDGEFSPVAASAAATATAGVGDASESDMRIEGGSALVVARVRVSQGGGGTNVAGETERFETQTEMGRMEGGGVVIGGRPLRLVSHRQFFFFKFIARFKPQNLYISEKKIQFWHAC
jgi:hypothetical protein